jgi:integrase
VPANPFHGVDRPGREKSRERALAADEIGEIWRACDALYPTGTAFVRTLMLTAQRREEVAGMVWSELDSPDSPSTWTLPGSRAKNGRTTIIHQSQPVRDILARLPRIVGNPHVFPGRGGNGFKNFSNVKKQLDTAIAKRRSPLPDWRFHDFRRTVVTSLAAMGFAPHVCDRLLNHITGSIQGVAAVYQRHEFLDERAEALDAWSAFALAAIGNLS